MKHQHRSIKSRALLLGLLYALTTLPVFADDTEIFFGSTLPSADAVYPNVLFILDTSGSMDTEVGNTNKSRMEHMKEALENLLSTIDNVNVGLMRFNDPGGPILFPVSYINEALNVATATDPGNNIASRVSASTDDATEKSGTVDLTNTRLEMAYGGGGTASNYSRRVNQDRDDAEETLSNGNISRNGNVLNMNSSQINGIRFTNTGIPQGANITSANLVFRSYATYNNPVTLRFYGQDDNDAGSFGFSNYNISSRTKTTASVDWTPNAWSGNQDYTSPDISAIIQELVNRSGWASDDLVILQTHVSGDERGAITHNNDPNHAPQLNISWNTGTSGNQTTGLRFQDIAIPQGATITSAVIEFTGSATNTDAMNLSIDGVADDDAATFSTSSLDITSRTGTTNTVSWAPGTWNDGDVIQTPDLTDVVQEIVNRSGWCGNNAMAFRVSGSDTFKRVAYSYDGDPTRAPILRVTYDDSNIPAGGGCMNSVQVYRIDAENNDAEETISGGGMSLNGSVFNMQASQVNGLRFTNLFVNQGATILEASLEFTAAYSDTGSSNITFKAEAADDSQVFASGDGNISDRSTTTASVTWAAPSFTNGSTYTTPDLKDLVQEVVNRSNWAAGNALSFIQTASSNDRRAVTYRNSPGSAALLRLKVQQGGAATAITKTVRDKLQEIVSEFTPGGYTPIVDSLYEGAMYYRGGPVTYGRTRGSQTRYGRLSHTDSYTGGTVIRDASCTDSNLNATACANEYIDGSPVYTTPITDACQSNYVVLLTDGQANHNHSTSEIKSLIGNTTCGSDSGGENCGVELTHWLANNDQSTSTAGNNLDGDQTVKTYTIGFNLDDGGNAGAIQFLQDLANNGDGTYQTASTADELTGVFQNIIRDVLNLNTTFVSPGVAVDQFSRLSHQNDIYFSLFKPDDRPRWPGNVKRYQLVGNPAVIKDQNDVAAIDLTTGFFKTGAQSYWSTAADGNEVTLGGAASKLTLTRNIYTYTGTSNDLTDSSNVLAESNTAITKAMLGIDTATDAERTALLQWARGVDIKDFDEDGDTTEVRTQYGAPLHSQPVLITYGGTASLQDNTLFASTNEGYLHVIDPDDGTEVFSFVPQELLPNLDRFYTNSTVGGFPYGLDGSIAVWVKDYNGNNQIEATDADGNHDHVYVYLTMRRGGRNIYALDVTNRNAPQILWTKFGGSGDYAELGQTWSKPILTQVKIGSTIKDVLVFAGGYDPNQDDVTVRTTDSMGRAIFIVDASNGDVLWSGGPDNTHDEIFSQMQYSIPSTVSVVDINGDNLADQMYVGDMGGQIWRFDIFNGAADAASLVTGGVIADFSRNPTDGSHDAANNRRFYYAPDVALLSKDGVKYLSISVGSGWRAHPLDKVVEDKFYSIRDNHIYSAPSSYSTVYEYNASGNNDLYDATDNLLGEGTTVGDGTGTKEVAAATLAARSGWLIRLENAGEKVLAESTTVNGQVLFTTYQPDVTSASVCSAGQGLGRFYAVSSFDATPVIDTDNNTTYTKSDRSTELVHAGIPPAPAVIYPKGGGPLILIGTETGPVVNFGDGVVPTYWYEDTQ